MSPIVQRKVVGEPRRPPPKRIQIPPQGNPFGRLITALSALLVLSCWWLPPLHAQRIVLKGGVVVDGSGGPRFLADVAILDGRIEAVGPIDPQPGDEVVAVRGLVVAPGFIDLHNHSTEGLLNEPEAKTQVSQGITTVLMGPDGEAPFPPGRYFDKIAEKGTAINIALMVGHGTVRSLILGSDYKRVADRSEIGAMAALVRVGISQGAFGLSSGLEYDPGFYSSTDELTELARAAGGLYMSHIRDEEEGFREAVEEAIEIGRRAGVPVQISHLKLGNKTVWGRAAELLALIHQANAQGMDVKADCYPYNAWASDLSVLVPSRRFDDPDEVAKALEKVGGPSKVLITRYTPDPSFEFKNLEEIATDQRIDPVDLFRQMIANGGAGVVCESMSQADVEALYRDPLVMVASDGGLDLRHPRKAGTFTRVLGGFVREKKLFSVEEAIHKMTGLPAAQLHLTDRGRVAPGWRADLVVFDPARVIDRATFENPDRLSEGVVHTFVNGVEVWRMGTTTAKLPGMALKKTAP